MDNTNDDEQLNQFKQAMRIPLDDTEDDVLIKMYLDTAEAYVNSAIDDPVAPSEPTLFKFCVSFLAQYLYLHRDDDSAMHFPIEFDALLNNLRFSN